ncbi:MAG TPA: hypothetical protein VEY07_02380 [Thermoplasmata archaeon]|nr:hypothetical protein [Thermoplasmata archaeon]
MPPAALVRGGEHLYLVRPGQAARPLGDLPRSALVDPSGARPLPSWLLAPVREEGARGPIACDDLRLVERLAAAGLRVVRGDVPTLVSARRRLPRPEMSLLRTAALTAAREALATALARPEEALIALAREEERLERAAHRERAAQEEILVGASGPLQRYAESGQRLRSDLDRHVAALHDELDRLCEEVAPNLRELLGASLSSRLIAAGGGLARLATVSGARLQLLGTRRRPSPVRGPRYGFILRAPRMLDVPPDRRAAFARSLAALAVIAARADAFTHRRIARELVSRRDRRITALRKGA